VLTTRGIPQLYYGDEIAMTGADEPTTRGDFPGGFPGDKRDAFTREGRAAEQQDLFDYVRTLVHLHTELEPLQRGSLVNLYASDQQYAYARTTKNASVVTIINNDSARATIEFDVSRVGLPNGAVLIDRLGVSRELRVADGKVQVTLPGRAAAIFVRK
jgi:glycosidase